MTFSIFYVSFSVDWMQTSASLKEQINVFDTNMKTIPLLLLTRPFYSFFKSNISFLLNQTFP